MKIFGNIDLASNLRTITGTNPTTPVQLDSVESFLSSGREIWIHENVAPTGWTIVAATGDSLLGVKGGTGTYNTSGGLGVGTWTQPNHSHSVSVTSGASGTDATGSAGTGASGSASPGTDSQYGTIGSTAPGTDSQSSTTGSGGADTTSAQSADHYHTTFAAGEAEHTHTVAGQSVSISFTTADTNKGDGISGVFALPTGATGSWAGPITSSDATWPHAPAVTDGASAGHTHTTPGHTHSGDPHSHTVASHTHTGDSHSHTVASHTHTGPSHTHTGPSHTHSVSTTSADSATANTWRPLARLGIIVKKD